ncbi:MAG: septum formation initiator family protein [Nitrospinota bacterium]|nr:MAG: septum formation initiator family protein [Nitrospinota bacterium]
MESLRQTIRTPRFWFMVSLLLSLLLVGMAVFGDQGILQVYFLEQDLQEMRQRLQLLQQENRALWQEIHALKHDPDYIEKIAREELGLARPGEIIFEIQDVPGLPPPSGSRD